MAYTQSGHSVISSYGDPLLARLVVAGVNIAPGVRAGDVHTILGWVAQRFNNNVQPLRAGQCWGYAPRTIRGGSGWSNHAGGTAIDLNSAHFPQGTTNMTRAQRNACKAIVNASGGVVRWGGSYRWPTKKDQMHFEINNNLAGTAKLKTFAVKIRGGATPVKPSITKSGLTVARAQTLLNRTGVGAPLEVDGAYGPKTASAVERFQHAHHLPVTGTINDATWNVLRQWSTKYVQEPASVRQTAIERMHEIQGDLGLSDGAVAHLETAYQNIAKATSDPALKTALARYRELLDGVDVGASAFQHLRTAIKNVEKTM